MPAKDPVVLGWRELADCASRIGDVDVQTYALLCVERELTRDPVTVRSLSCVDSNVNRC